MAELGYNMGWGPVDWIKEKAGNLLGPALPALAGPAAPYYGADRDRKNALNDAQTARNYNTDLSNTSYERAMNDMRRSGLNPILAMHGGASTPAAVVPGPSQFSDAATKTINNATSLARASPEIQNIRADTQLKTENATASRTQGVLNGAQTFQAEQNAVKATQETRNLEQEQKNMKAEFGLIEAQRANTGADVKNKQNQNTLFEKTLPYALKKAKVEGDTALLKAIGEISSQAVSTGLGVKNMVRPNLNYRRYR